MGGPGPRAAVRREAGSVVLALGRRRARLFWDADRAVAARAVGLAFHAFRSADVRGVDLEVDLGALVAPDGDPGRALVALTTLALEAHDERWAVHALCCRLGGRTMLLPAGSGSGKSTLAAALAAEGAAVLSDEVGWLDLAAGVVHPFPRALLLAEHALAPLRERLESLGAHVAAGLVPGSVAVQLPPVAQPAGPAPGPHLVVFCSYASGASPSLHPLSRARAAAGLAELTLRGPGSRPEGIVDDAIALCGRAPACAIRYGSTQDALRLLERFAEGSEPSG